MAIGPRHPDSVQDRLQGQLVAPLAALGYDLEALELTPAGKRRVLRVAVDADDGVSLDAVAEASRTVSSVLDEDPVCRAALGEQPYTLEVTSRGVDRPLTLPRHWRRNRTRMVRVTLGSGDVLVGRVIDSDDQTVTLEADAVRRVVPLAEVTKALVQVEFNRRATAPDADENDTDENDTDDDVDPEES